MISNLNLVLIAHTYTTLLWAFIEKYKIIVYFEVHWKWFWDINRKFEVKWRRNLLIIFKAYYSLKALNIEHSLNEYYEKKRKSIKECVEYCIEWNKHVEIFPEKCFNYLLELHTESYTYEWFSRYKILFFLFTEVFKSEFEFGLSSVLYSKVT